MKPPVLFALGLLLSATFSVCAHAESDGASAGKAPSCRYSVAYTAPATCSDVGALEQRLGTNYRVERGSMEACDDCVLGIAIRRRANAASYQMQLAGLESKPVERTECSELLDLAVYAIEASDLPAPECAAATGAVGLSSIPLINVFNVDPMVLMALRATLVLGAWQMTPFALWLLPSQVPSHAQANVTRELRFTGFGAGVEACHAILSSLQLCGGGMWRHLDGIPASSNWNVASAADIWTLGAGVAWRLPVTTSLRFEVEPMVMAVLSQRGLADADSHVQLYSHAGAEALLRVGFLWELGASSTPVNTQALRAAATPHSTSPNWASTQSRLWF